MSQAQDFYNVSEHINADHIQHLLDCQMKNIKERRELNIWTRKDNKYHKSINYVFDDDSIIQAIELSKYKYTFQVIKE